MAIDDFRRWIDVDARDGREGAIALEVDTDGRIVLSVSNAATPESAARGDLVDLHSHVVLDYSDAGMLLDALREGMNVQLARTGHPVAIAAVAGVRLARDTPAGG